MPDSFQLEMIVAAEPQRVFSAWMDSREHAAFTGGGEAVVEPWAGGRFIAWDGYIHGILLGVDEGRRIVQTWRTSEFPPGARDSRLVVEFEPARGGTRVIVRHSDLPSSHVKKYERGWTEHYLKALARYFAKGAKQRTPAARAPESGLRGGGARSARPHRRPRAYRQAARMASPAGSGRRVPPRQAEIASAAGARRPGAPRRTLFRRNGAPRRAVAVDDGEDRQVAVGARAARRQGAADASLAVADHAGRTAARCRLPRRIQCGAPRSRQREGHRAADAGVRREWRQPHRAPPARIRSGATTARPRPAHRARGARADGALVALAGRGPRRTPLLGGPARDRHRAVGRAAGGRRGLRARPAAMEGVGHRGAVNGPGGEDRPALRGASLAAGPGIPARARRGSAHLLAAVALARTGVDRMGREPQRGSPAGKESRHGRGPIPLRGAGPARPAHPGRLVRLAEGRPFARRVQLGAGGGHPRAEGARRPGGPAAFRRRGVALRRRLRDGARGNRDRHPGSARSRDRAAKVAGPSAPAVASPDGGPRADPGLAQGTARARARSFPRGPHRDVAGAARLERTDRSRRHAALRTEARSLQGGRDGPRLARISHQGRPLRRDRRPDQAAGPAFCLPRSRRPHPGGALSRAPAREEIETTVPPRRTRPWRPPPRRRGARYGRA